jgi:hypothetical protein
MLWVAAAGPAAAQSIDWEERYYNPQPLPDDLVLPMPCGGGMTFVRVITPVAGDDLLDDVQVTLGETGEDTNFSDYVRQEYIAGSLSDRAPLGGGRALVYFFMGKYEVTEDQYQAVLGDGCPTPSIRGRRPASDLAWFDAVQFGRAYTEWLFQNAPDRLPREGDRLSYLRLPTEIEWEYAARGGARVDSNTEFRQRLFPMTGSVSEYAWFQGPRSAAGQRHPVGLLEPNPLGLYDMLGNVEEFTLDPFQMNRVGREHGQVGGFVTRGGSYLTAESDLSTAHRTEYSYFDESQGTATRLPTFGLRLVVSAPVTVSQQRITAIRQAWDEARRFRVSTEAFDPIETLQAIVEGTTDVQLKGRLEQVAAAFNREVSSRNEIEARAIRRAIDSGAVLIRVIRSDNHDVNILETIRDRACREGQDNADCRRREGQLATAQERLRNTLRAYIDIVVQAATDYRLEEIEEQLAIQLQSYEQNDLEAFVGFARLFFEQTRAYEAAQSLDPDDVLVQIIEL